MGFAWRSPYDEAMVVGFEEEELGAVSITSQGHAINMIYGGWCLTLTAWPRSCPSVSPL